MPKSFEFVLLHLGFMLVALLALGSWRMSSKPNIKVSFLIEVHEEFEDSELSS